jgi:hypothetical protein
MNTNKISELPDHDRYEYLLRHVVKNREIWLLHAKDGLYAMFEDEKGQQYIPVWPEKEFADSYAVDDWEGYEAEGMGFNEFINWMKELKDDQIFIGAFPNNRLEAIPLDPMVFKTQLEQAGKEQLPG